MLQLLAHIIKLLDFTVREVELFLGSFNVRDHVGLRLVRFSQEALAKLDLRLQVFNLAVLVKDILLQLLVFFLLSLQTIGEKKRLLNSSLGGSRGACDGLDQGIADRIGSIVINSGISSHVHDSLIELFLNEFIVSKSLRSNS